MSKNGWDWVDGKGRGNGDPPRKEVTPANQIRIWELESKVKRLDAESRNQYELAQARAKRIFELQGECGQLREDLRTEGQVSYALRKEVERLRRKVRNFELRDVLDELQQAKREEN